MRISIITAAYNGAQFLASTLESVLNQSETDWEHILVDDGSVDQTFELAKQFAMRDSRFRTFRIANSGVARARNFGYSQTTKESEFIVFLDHDDIWKQNALTRLINALSEQPSYVAAHGLTRMTDLNGLPIGEGQGTIMGWDRRKVVRNSIVKSLRQEPTTFAHLICDCFIPTPGVGLIRRSAFEAIRQGDVYFNPAVAPGDDWDVWLRLSLIGDISFVDEVLLDWRQHGSNVSKNAETAFTAMSNIRKTMCISPILSKRQHIMALWRYRRVYAAVERRHAAEIMHKARMRLHDGEWIEFVQLLRHAIEIYFNYLGARHFWNNRVSSWPPLALLPAQSTSALQ